MGKGINNSDSRRLDVRLSPETYEYLQGLAKLGIHGSTAAEVAKHLIRLGVQSVVRDAEVERILSDRERLKGL